MVDQHEMVTDHISMRKDKKIVEQTNEVRDLSSIDGGGVNSFGTKKTKAPSFNRELAMVGFLFSAAYLVFTIVLGVFSWGKLWSLSPNEFGDLMAGVFAPLAFLWLVLGFFQQGRELQASVRALELQGEELRNSVEQQRELVAVSREHMESEIAAIAQERLSAEFAAQPTLVPIGGGSYSGNMAQFTVGFVNAGADVTNVILWVDDNQSVERPVLAKGENIQTKVTFEHHDIVSETTGYVTYYDALGNLRARRFIYPFAPNAGPNDRHSLGPGQIEDTLYKPPFPWE